MIKIQKTRRPHKKDAHNRRLFHERKFGTPMYPKNHHQEFLNNLENCQEEENICEVEEERVIEETPTPSLINDFKPKVLTPTIPEPDMLEILNNPKLLQDFKKFQEFMKIRDSPIIPATPAPSPMLTSSLEPFSISPTLSPIAEENHSRDLVNYVTEEELEDLND